MFFKMFKPWAERQTGSQMKAVRHGDAKELNFGIFASLMKDWGVEQENSIDYEHEQNGVAEISNRSCIIGQSSHYSFGVRFKEELVA